MRRRTSLWLAVLGLLFLPFTTSPEDGAVVSFGLPFLVLAVLIGIDSVFQTLLRSNGWLQMLIITGAIVAIVPLPLALLSPTPAPSLFRAAVFCLGYVFALWVLGIANDRRQLEAVGHAFTAYGLVLAGYYILNFAWKAMDLGLAAVALERYVGGGASLPWGASNIVAGALLLPLVAYLVTRDPAKSEWWERFFPVLGVVAIALTFSRTGTALALLSLLILTKRLGYRRLAAVALGLTALLATVSYWLFSLDANAIEELIASRTRAEGLEALGGRIDIWASRLRLVPDALLSPNGYYSSLHIFDGVSPHNTLITVALEQGLLGLLASAAFLTLLFTYFAKYAITQRRGSQTRGPLVASRLLRWMWALVFVHLFVEDLGFNQQYAIGFWTLFGLSTAYWETIRTTISRDKLAHHTSPRQASLEHAS